MSPASDSLLVLGDCEREACDAIGIQAQADGSGHRSGTQSAPALTRTLGSGRSKRE
jgi:hypothetical protein